MKRVEHTRRLSSLRILLLLLLNVRASRAEDRKVDPTWLHRYVPSLTTTRADLTSPSCQYKAIFGEGDSEGQSMISVARFGELVLNAPGHCETIEYDRR